MVRCEVYCRCGVCAVVGSSAVAGSSVVAGSRRMRMSLLAQPEGRATGAALLTSLRTMRCGFRSLAGENRRLAGGFRREERACSRIEFSSPGR